MRIILRPISPHLSAACFLLALSGKISAALYGGILLTLWMRERNGSPLRCTKPGSRITLRSRRLGDRLEFRVEDSGDGIDAVDLPRILE